MDAAPLTTSADPQQLSARHLIRLIGLTLALAYLVVLGGSYLQGDWTAHKAAEVEAIGHDFHDYYGCTTRRHSSSSPWRWRCCLISSPRSCG